MDALAALRLQIEWGADEAIDPTPLDRLTQAAALPAASGEEAAGPPAPSPGPARSRAERAAAEAATPEALRAALEVFDGCALRDTAAHLVFAEGDPTARLMLVGDVPGADEDRIGRPFAGAAGAYLDRMLASIGLTRADAAIAMLVPWRPPGGRPPSDVEIAACRPFLMRQIALVRPRWLVLLGSVVARSLLGGLAGPRRPRATWIPVPIPGRPEPIPALCMASPAALIARPDDRRRAWAELRLLRRTLDEADALARS